MFNTVTHPTTSTIEFLAAPIARGINHIADGIALSVKYWRRRRAYNETWRELSRLSPREMRDIGIGYNDIRSIAEEAADMV